jgi:exopolysaccharide biosynthesis protein
MIIRRPSRIRPRSRAVFAVLAVLCGAFVATGAPIGGQAADAASCSISVSPYRGAHVVAVAASHGVTVRRYTKRGMSTAYVATADASRAVAQPILPTAVSRRETVPAMIKRSRAIVAVNGDFFRIRGDGTSMSVEVVRGRVVKATSHWQPALMTLADGRVVYGPVRADIVLTVNRHKALASNLNDTSMPTNGIAVFNRSWGIRQPIRRAGIWREWVVSNGRVVATHNWPTRAGIPVRGYVVEASGTGAARLTKLGWRTGARVTARAYPRSVIGSAVYSALGAGVRLAHQGFADRGGCESSPRAARTLVGIWPGGRHIALVTVSHGRGLTQREAAAFVRSLGAREVISLDGGGSTAMATHSHLFTVPQWGTDRRVANAYGLFARS